MNTKTKTKTVFNIHSVILKLVISLESLMFFIYCHILLQSGNLLGARSNLYCTYKFKLGA